MSVYKWRLKDAKLNSRGLLSPWKPRHTPTENRLEDGNRQRIQRLKVDGHADHTLIQTKDVFDERSRITCLTLFNLYMPLSSC